MNLPTIFKQHLVVASRIYLQVKAIFVFLSPKMKKRVSLDLLFFCNSRLNIFIVF